MPSKAWNQPAPERSASVERRQDGKSRHYSIRNKLLVGLLVFLAPLVALLLVYNFYTVEALREKTALSNQNTLSIYSEIVEAQLTAIDSVLIDATFNNDRFFLARNSDSELKIYLAAYDINANLAAKMPQTTTVSLYFTMVKGFNREIYSNATLNSLAFQQRQDMHTQLSELVADQPRLYNTTWQWIELAGQDYLMRIVGGDGVYAGALIDLESLVYPLAKSTLFEDYEMLYAKEDKTALTQTELVEKSNIDLTRIGDGYYLSGKPERYLVLSTDLNRTNVRMVALIPDPTYLAGLNIIQIALFALSLLAILVIPLVILFLRRSFVRPLGQLVGTMSQIRAGNLDARAEDEFVADEFRQVNETFNEMIGQIQTLKIDAYEQALARQKAELQYLQFQIKPHFFLNSLKILYGLAERGKTDAVQEIILALSSHFRYMFKDNSATVTLKDELNYVKNYIHIQRLYKSSACQCEIDVDESLMDLPILPLTIQTFVENAIKHGRRAEADLKIQIRARLLHTEEEGDFAVISVADNGNGFSREMLDKLNFAEPMSVDESHIGLSNVRQRLALKYQGHAHLAFANTAGGALIEMILPLDDQITKAGEPS